MTKEEDLTNLQLIIRRHGGEAVGLVTRNLDLTAPQHTGCMRDMKYIIIIVLS